MRCKQVRCSSKINTGLICIAAKQHAPLTISRMNKAFVKESDNDDDDDGLEGSAPPIPPGAKNYITPQGHQRMKDELLHLIDVERPEVVRIVSWAASNGDRSENGDYIYGKRRLREIDRRIRFLTKRLDIAEVVEPSIHHGNDQIFFGATVVYENMAGERHTVTIVGIDEFDPLNGKISWISPVARALTKAREGESVVLKTPAGMEELEIIEVRYPAR
jgi:transcription elongation factor GreB